MLMDSIKSILSKFKVNDTSDTVKEIINKNSTTINNLDIPAELETYKAWEEQMLEKLATNTLALTEYKHRIQKTLELLQQRKEELIKAAEDIANSRETVSTVYPQVEATTAEFPWNSPVLITHLATLNSSSETPYYSVEELIQNVFIKDSLNSDITHTPGIDNNTKESSVNTDITNATVDTVNIDLLLDQISTNIARNISLYTSINPCLIYNTGKPNEKELDTINDLLCMILETHSSPILNYSFENKPRNKVNRVLPYFINYNNSLQQLQTATIELLDILRDHGK